MSQQIERGNQHSSSSLGGGIQALRQSPEFHGPVESFDGHHCNDHFAQIYESDEERFAAAVPFVRHGLERGERVMYVIDRSSRSEVKRALRDGGVDVDTAVESGALSLNTIQETYLRDGNFDPDEMIDFYGDTVAEVTEEYVGLRIVAETTWLQEETTTVEQFMEYEAKINELFADTDSLAMCQYDRNGFPPEVIRDIVQSHPHLIYDGAVCHNVYYTPPAEFFGDDAPARQVNRMLNTLRDRAAAKNKLQRRDRFLQDLYTITADTTRSFDEKVQALFELGCDLFDMELGAMAQVDPGIDRFEIKRTSYDHEYFEPGLELELSETYCTAATVADGPAAVTDPDQQGYDSITVRREFGLESYLGTYITVPGDADRTFFFVTSDQRDKPVTETERTCLDLMGQWVQYELERRQREQFLRECYEITASQDRSFEEKLDALFELGCEQFDIDFGFLNRIDPDADRLEIEYASGEHPRYEVGDELPLSETYCQAAVDIEAAADIVDPAEEGYDDLFVYEEFGVDAYLGTYIPVEGGASRTLAFVPGESREEPFSEQDKAFVELMGQWVGYELQHKQYEQKLKETIDRLEQSNDRLKQFAYAASHDLQEPLRMVSSYLQLLENRYRNELDEDAQEYIDFAVDGADRMREMIDDLLAFSRVEHADGSFEPVDCDAILERVTDDLQVQIKEADAEVVTDSLPTVAGDTEQLEQLFSNLVSNAIKYNESDPPRVEITAEKRSDRVEFAVTDNGIGMDPEKTDQIFEVFKRLHHDGDYPGTGIGLSLCQEIVNSHGGKIWVDSEPGEGSTFSFILPATSTNKS